MITVFWDGKGVILQDKNPARGENQLTPTSGCRRDPGSILKQSGLTRIGQKSYFSMTIQCCTQICRLVQPSQNLLGQCYHNHNPALLVFNLFRVLKKAIYSTKFATDDDVLHTVRTWLHEQNKAWYQQGIRSTLALYRHRARDVDGNCGKTGYGIKPSLFITCNFCNL